MDIDYGHFRSLLSIGRIFVLYPDIAQVYIMGNHMRLFPCKINMICIMVMRDDVFII